MTRCFSISRVNEVTLLVLLLELEQPIFYRAYIWPWDTFPWCHDLEVDLDLEDR